MISLVGVIASPQTRAKTKTIGRARDVSDKKENGDSPRERLFTLLSKVATVELVSLKEEGNSLKSRRANTERRMEVRTPQARVYLTVLPKSLSCLSDATPALNVKNVVNKRTTVKASKR